MTDTRGPKEKSFDEKVKPLLEMIRDVCEANNINFAAYFALDEVMKNCILQSRTAKIHDESDLAGMQCVLKIWEAIMDGEDHFDESLPTGGVEN